MEFLKKRQNAVAVFVVVVILFSLIGCHTSLSRVCRKTEAAFFDKTVSGESTAPADHIDNCLKYANRLLSVIGNSAELSSYYDDILDARQELSEALDEKDIEDIFEENEELNECVEALALAVDGGAELPASNDDYGQILSDFRGAQTALANNGYNDYVDEFIRTTIRPFPTNLLRLVSFVELPEKFQ